MNNEQNKMNNEPNKPVEAEELSEKELEGVVGGVKNLSLQVYGGFFMGSGVCG